MKKPSLENNSSHGATDKYEPARLQLLKIAADDDCPCHSLLTQIAKLTSDALNVERVGVWVLVDRGQTLRCYHLYQRSNEQVFAGAVLHAEDFPTYFAALRSHRAIPADHARTDPLTHELDAAYLQPLAITAMLDAPIYSNGRVIGVVCHEHIGPPREMWTDADYSFAASVADTLSRLLAEVKRKQAEDSNRRYEEHLMEVERMEAMGRAAAHIGHDFRNALMAIRGFADLIVADTTDAQIRNYAQRIIDTTDRGRTLTQELLGFTQHQPSAPRIHDLHDAIDSLRPMLQVLASDSIRVEFDLDTTPSGVLIDTAQLERAVVNLAINACDAMAEGGHLTISLRNLEVSHDNNVCYAVLSVSDTGAGMSDEVRSRIFEPFFTTKGKLGTGLGLAIVDQIVTRAGGFIEVESAPGRGTTFSVYLPRITQPHATEHA